MAFCANCGKELPSGVAFCPACGAPVRRSTSAPQTSTSVSGFDTLTKDQVAQEYWIQRLIAYVIDAIVVFGVLGVITLLVALPVLFLRASFFSLFFGGISLLWGIIFILYFAVTESMSGASLGKRIFKLKVVSKSGTNPSLGVAFVRSLSKLHGLLLLLDVIVGLATSKGYQQKYSDRLMGTKVVHT